MAAGELPPQLRNQLQMFQQLQEQAQGVVAQRVQVESQVRELDRALQELARVADDAPIYKAAGALLVRTKDKATAEAEVRESKEIADVRLTSLKRQEEKVREKLTSMQRELQAALSAQQGALSGPRDG